MKPAVLAVDEDLRALEEDGAKAKGRPCRARVLVDGARTALDAR
jgi:hypothetical protein